MFPPLDPLGDPNSLDLGVGPAPTAPVAPTLGESPDAAHKRRLMQIVASALAAGLGPGRGTGILQGVAQHQALSQRDQQLKDQQAAQLYQQQHQDYRYEQQQYEQEQNRRQQVVATNLDKLRTIAPTLKSKDEYDRYIDAFASGLQGMGVRVPANYLRTAVPFVSPDGKKTAAKAIEDFIKLPMNKDLLGDPERLKNVSVSFDRDGDGVDELVPFYKAAEAGGVQIAHNPDGTVYLYPSDTTADEKTNADGYFADLLTIAQSEGKRMTPQLRNELRDQALKRAKEAADITPPTTPRERFNVQPITLPDGTTGLVRINMDSGETTRVELPDGAGAGKPTDSQRLAGDYAGRAVDSNTQAMDFERTLSTLGSQFDVKLPNLLQSEAGQRYSQAKDVFINAALRRESGAAISQAEYDRYNKIYFVVPGDRPSVIRQKQQARANVIKGFKIGAGNIAPPTTAPPAGPTEKWTRDTQGHLVKQGAP